jgi:hypothetical protein
MATAAVLRQPLETCAVHGRHLLDDTMAQAQTQPMAVDLAATQVAVLTVSIS